MPKQKTHSGASKRFRLTASGRVKRAKSGKNHILTKKAQKRKVSLRQGAYVSHAQENTIKSIIPYK